VQVLPFVHPVAQRDDDVPFYALRACRLRKRQLALGDPIGPVAIIGERRRAQAAQLRKHLLARLTRLHPPPPCVCRRLKSAEHFGNRSRRLLAELMTADAPVVLHRADPVHLRQLRGDAALASELIGGGNLEHRVPVDRRIVMSGGGFARRDHCGNGKVLSRLCRRLGAVDEAVAARPDLVIRGREIGNDEPASVVRHDALDVPDGQVARFRNHPDTRFGTLGTHDNAADVVVVDSDITRSLLCVRGSEEQQEAKADEDHDRTEGQTPLLNHDSLHWAVMGRDASMSGHPLNQSEI
jgi:hypothetical protein